LVGNLLWHGYEVFVVDLDEQLHPALEAVAAGAPGKLFYNPIIDPRVAVESVGRSAPSGAPMAWVKMMRLQARWKDFITGEEAEPYSEWGPNRVVVFDSATNAVKAAFDKVTPSGQLSQTDRNGRPVGRGPKDYGNAADILYDYLDLWRGMKHRRFHIVWTFHLDRLEYDVSKTVSREEFSDIIGDAAKKREIGGDFTTRVASDTFFPSAVGSKQSSKIEHKFPYVVRARRNPSTDQVELQTVSDHGIVVRIPGRPRNWPAYLPAKDGLHKLFQHHLSLGGQTNAAA
jgi:hypothetical protein